MKKIFSSFLILVLSLGSSSSAFAKWKVDSYGNIKDGRSSVIISNEDTYNCRLSIASTTFSIVGDDGNALTADNPCIVGIKDNPTGKNVAAAFTAPVSFTFGATSDTDGNLFGLFGTNSWASSLPMFLGVVTDGTNNYFTLSRTPMRQTGAASTDVCQKNDVDCDAENDVMILTTGLTLSGWTGKNITQVGWIYGTYATTGSAWTFTITDGVTAARSGFNKNYEAIAFSFPAGQSGSAAGTYFTPLAGTPPAWGSITYNYFIDRNSLVQLNFLLNGDGGTDGSGSVNAELTIPYTFIKTDTTTNLFPVYIVTPTVTNFGTMGVTGGRITLGRNNSATTTATLQDADFTNGSRTIQGSPKYQLITN